MDGLLSQIADDVPILPLSDLGLDVLSTRLESYSEGFVKGGCRCRRATILRT